jgi:hypothetical protein
VLVAGAPLDMAISNDSKYFYVLEQLLPGIASFVIQPDGAWCKYRICREFPRPPTG